MLEERPPPPELPPELPELPPEEPLGIEEDGIEEEEDCWLGQPPIRKAHTVPTAVTWATTTGNDLRER
jgi:hypothetical protein